MATWKQLTIYISESDCWHHQPLYQAMLGIARQQKLTGVTVVRAIAGYGKHGVFRTLNDLDPTSESSSLPLLVMAIDNETAIAEFYASIEEMVGDKFVTCQNLEVF
jgi:PII-like signaling protein